LIELFVNLRVGSAQKTHILSHNPPTKCFCSEPAHRGTETRIADKRCRATATKVDVFAGSSAPPAAPAFWALEQDSPEVGRGSP
jgi:hypothetical protein